MHSLINKLCRYVELSEQHRRWIAALMHHNIRTGRPRRDLLREGDRPGPVRIVSEGWAVRYKALRDGRRQITGLILPGDIVAIDGALMEAMDHSVAAATPITFYEIEHMLLDQLCDRAPALRHALRIECLAANAIQREWTVNLGQRTARERLAHLFCEIFVRLDAVGLAEGNRCEMPLTQCDLGEASGMTSVHVNRTLQELRRDGFIVLHHRILTIPDFDALAEVAMFDSGYLHFRDWEKAPEFA